MFLLGLPSTGARGIRWFGVPKTTLRFSDGLEGLTELKTAVKTPATRGARSRVQEGPGVGLPVVLSQ